MAAVPDAVIEGVAGAIGAVISMTATYPLITVVTLHALETREDANGAGGSGSRRLPGALGALPAAVQEVIHHSRERGWRSLYAGLRPAVVATAASQGVYFYTYALLRGAVVAAQVAAAKQQRRALKAAALRAGRPPPPPRPEGADAHSADIGVPASLLVAAVAGCVNVVLTIPMWVVITQMQASAKKRGAGAARRSSGGGDGGGNDGSDATCAQGGGGTAAVAAPAAAARARGANSVTAVARRIYAERGLAGFYQGLRPSLAMVINPTIQYVLYEWLMARARGLKRAAGMKPRVGPAGIFVLSSLAKVGATLATYPMLVVKSRLQAANADTHDSLRYTGVADALRRMWAAEGLAGLYRGMRVKLAQTVAAAALMMVLKEEIYEWTHAALAGAPPPPGGR